MRSPRGVASLVIGALLLALGFLPLFGGPGYEHALASGLIVPSAAAVLTALELSRPAVAPVPLGCIGRGMANGAWLALVALATAFVHGLRVGFCDLAGGVLGFVLTAGIGSLLGGAWGAYVAERARTVRRRRLLAVLLALAAPLLGMAVSLWRFQASPMVFAYDPFFGYFSGTLYDTVIDAGAPLLTYRIGSAATLAGVLLTASLLGRRDDGRLTLLRAPGFSLRVSGASACFATSLAVTAHGPELGHWQTSASIASELGGRHAGLRCDVVHPDSLRADEIRLLVRDCDEQLGDVERTLGARGPERVVAFFFRDTSEKKRLMGAADTYIAKPWRGEVYLQMAAYPHPVLGHELAHVVAGSFGRGPFRIAGAAGGLIPNPGLIEGIAVAASPDEDELPDRIWARAMLDLGILPPLGDLFGLGFLGQASSKSYTLAGAVVGWVIERSGAEPVRRLYATNDPRSALGKDWRELDAEFRAWLATIPVPAEAASFARAKFDRPSVFHRRCPHVVDGLLHRAHACRDAQQIDKAVGLYGEVLRRDPHDLAARHARGVTNVRFGDHAGGRAELERLAHDDKTPRTWRDRATEALADDDFLGGAADRAADTYRQLAARSLDEDSARMLEVKAIAASDPRARIPVRTLLLGDVGRGPDLTLAAAQIAAWREETHDPLADYLLGKNLAQHAWHAEARTHLAATLSAGPPTPRIHRETLRQLAVAGCALDDLALTARIRAEIDGDASPYRATAGGRLEALRRQLTRCSTPAAAR